MELCSHYIICIQYIDFYISLLLVANGCHLFQNAKRGRWAFELRLAGGGGTGGSTKVVCLAAENETELAEWVAALKAVVTQNRQTEDKRTSDKGTRLIAK